MAVGFQEFGRTVPYSVATSISFALDDSNCTSSFSLPLVGYTASHLSSVHSFIMAKALLCKDCNTMLANVKEAQSHNEITGHANFEETTEAVCGMQGLGPYACVR